MLRALLACVVLALLYFIFVPGTRLSSPSRVGLYYVLPTSVLAILGWAFRGGAERRASVALAFLAILGPLYVFEAILPLADARRMEYGLTAAEADTACPGVWGGRPVCSVAKSSGRAFDTRVPLEVIRDLAAEGVEAWPTVGSGNALRLPEAMASGPGLTLEVASRRVTPVAAGLAGVLTVFCNESGEWLLYDADEYGFRNPPGLHRPGDVDVAIVGDSYAHGYCVEESGSVAGVLRERMPNTLNLGVRGTGPLSALAVVREYATPLRPRWVVWMFYEGNDLDDLLREMDHPLLPRYLDPTFGQDLRASQPEVDLALRGWLREVRAHADAESSTRESDEASGPSRVLRTVWGWVRLRAIRRKVRNAFAQPFDEPYPYRPELFSRIAARMRDDVLAAGGTLLFVYVPDYERFAGRGLENPFRDRILETVRGLDIEVVDATPSVERHADPLSLFTFRVPAHYNAEGYRVVAEPVRAAIEPRDPTP